MTIILDSNVLIAALIKPGIVRAIVIGNPGEWLVPEAIFEEVWEHRIVWNRRGLPDTDLHGILDMLSEDFINIVSDRVYSGQASIARHLVTDPEDWPLVALALSVANGGIWTFNERHLAKSKNHGIRLLKTSDVAGRYPPEP
jgi:predicted nucleic acid-binding protein